MADHDRPTWSCGHPVSPDPSIEEARLHVGHAVDQKTMGDRMWVAPVVSGAEVDPTETCTLCAACMVRLAIGGLHDDGVVDLPPILICPDCYNPQQVVAEWRAKAQGKGHHA